ncbi:hypothetical protein, partial [Psychrobacter sp. CAL346-MNA-CIBAN-0220]|uniref:hypothetical protein n=1 Tax=Psychrobacter sp. CAL346-MNA-CIBAN-0220 TaxID=3140457 RepID=UPI00332975F7
MSIFGNRTTYRANTRKVMKVRVAHAPRKWRMPMRVHCAITRLFTEIPRNMQSDRGEFAKRDPFIARHCT